MVQHRLNTELYVLYRNKQMPMHKDFLIKQVPATAEVMSGYTVEGTHQRSHDVDRPSRT
jgi:hypothetical protein